MSVTIQQGPNNDINASNSDVLYVLSSTNIDEPLFQYVCDVKDDQDNLLYRIKQRPNPNAGIGVFNLQQLIHNRLDHDIEAYRTLDELYSLNDPRMFVKATNGIQRYKIAFGEEFAPSISGSTSVYNGVGNVVGDPSVQHNDFEYTYFIDATLDRNSATSPTLDLTRFFTSTGNQYESTGSLTNMPRKYNSISDDDPMFVGVFNGQEASGSSTYNDITSVSYLFYDQPNQQGSIVGIESYYNIYATNGDGSGDPSSPIRTGTTQTTANAVPFSDISGSFFEDDTYKNRLTYVQIGTSNIDLPAGTKSYSVAVIDDGIILDTFGFNIEEDCNYPTYRLAWLNEYGCFDFYNFDALYKRGSTRTDSKFERGFINYSVDAVNESPYNRVNRGMKNYHTQRQQTTSVNTKYLNRETSDWLEGLFLSPEVYLIDEQGPIPVMLTSTNYQEKTNLRTEKLRSYEVSFTYSNTNRPY